MANVYLSFLGTNDYLDCSYYRNGFETPAPVRFVQEATVLLRCRDWGKSDRIMVFTTEDAKAKNWVDDGHRAGGTNAVLSRSGLDSCLRSLKLVVPHRNIDIPEGYSEAEIWDVFQAIYDALDPGDKVVFDITHAFRSIPLVAIIVLHYAKVLKQVHLEGIYYGAFEILGSIQSVRKMPVAKRRVPILDLTALDQLMDWTIATDRFLGSGDATYAASLASASVEALLRKTRGRDEAARTIRSLSKALGQFSRAFTTCRGPDISRVVADLKARVSSCRELELHPPFKPLFEKIENRLAAFLGGDMNDGLTAIHWCLDHHLIQQGFTILEEILFNYVVAGTGGDPMDVTLRNISSQAFFILNNKITDTPDDWLPPAKDDEGTTRKMIEFIEKHVGLQKEIERVRTIRNDLNHAGYCDHACKAGDAGKFSEKLKTILERVETILSPTA